MRGPDMKATAVAHPIQGLIKYHGLADPVLRLPFHDSISVCTAPLTSRTTVEFGGVGRDSATIDGRDVNARDMERIRAVVDVIRGRASLSQPFRMASVNDFPSNIALVASASGFAALATAAAHAAGLRLPPEEISRFARRGAGSASRSVTGGVAIAKEDGTPRGLLTVLVLAGCRPAGQYSRPPPLVSEIGRA